MEVYEKLYDFITIMKVNYFHNTEQKLFHFDLTNNRKFEQFFIFIFLLDLLDTHLEE